MDKEAKAFTAMLCIVLLTAATLWVGHAYMKARTYYKLTGQEISTFDALWIELRVNVNQIEPGKEKKE